jgi:hypothetical protein
MTKFGSLLREARLELGLTQWAVGEHVGRNPPCICSWEIGGTLPIGGFDIESLEGFLQVRPGTLRHAYERDRQAQQKNLTGQRFGRLTVEGYVDPKRANLNRQQCWLCRCDCGKVTIVPAGSLKSEATRSCGCLLREASHRSGIIRKIRKQPHKHDLEGHSFGMLTVISWKPQRKPDLGGWLCRCKCGNDRIVRSALLLKGKVVSCGARGCKGGKPPRTECKRGHLLYKENIYLMPNGTRACKICRGLASQRATRRRHKRRRSATHCLNGHDKTDEKNIYISPGGQRHCRACRSDNARKSRSKAKAQ